MVAFQQSSVCPILNTLCGFSALGPCDSHPSKASESSHPALERIDALADVRVADRGR